MFLEKHSGKSTFRKNNVSVDYNETRSEIQKIIGNDPNWVSLDETTDVNSHCIADMPVCYRPVAYNRIIEFWTHQTISFESWRTNRVQSIGRFLMARIKYENVISICSDTLFRMNVYIVRNVCINVYSLSWHQRLTCYHHPFNYTTILKIKTCF